MSEQPEYDLIGILSALQHLSRLLTSDPLTVGEVRQALANLALPGVVEAEPGSQSPAFVRLPLSPRTALTLAALEETFAPARQLPGLHRGAPDEYLISLGASDTPYTCTLLVEKQPETDFIAAVTLRRDLRLD